MGDTKNAKALIKRLLKNNPEEMNSVFLLMKIEFLLENYREALKNGRKILEASDRMSVSRQLTLSSLIYASICYLRLDQKNNLESFVKILFELSNAEELGRIVEAENLIDDWGQVLRVAGR